MTDLFWHYFSVQEFMHGQEKSGAVHRTSFPFIAKNIKCQIQIRSKLDAQIKYDVKVAEKLHVIYYNPRSLPEDLELDETKRIIINRNYLKKITFPPQAFEVKILEYKGSREAVNFPNAHDRIFELYVEHNKRWVL